MVIEAAPKPAKPKPRMLAKLEGKVFLTDRDVDFKQVMRRPVLLMGRSDHNTMDTHPFKPAKEGVHVGLGISNKLSRAHARIELHRPSNRFFIHCLGKNGLSVTHPGTDEDVRITPDSDPLPLSSRSVIKLADCCLVFSLPADTSRRAVRPPPTRSPSRSSTPSHSSVDDSFSPPSRKRKRREWIKAEHIALRAHMMRLGYGRWQEIINSTNGRLSERNPAELVPVARKFVAHCYVHARPGVEQKALMDILREQPLSEGLDEDAAAKEIEELLRNAREDAEPTEKRKYVRWARKLRLLSRLRDVHDHPSLDRLRVGELRVFTPPPALYWTSADDADLILGSYKHGYGATEAMRNDPELGFHDRYAKPISTKKPGTPSKAEKTSDGMNGSDDDDDDDDEDADEDEDERHSHGIDDIDDEKSAEGPVPHNPKKRLKLGERSTPKKGDKRPDVADDASSDPILDDSDASPQRERENLPSSASAIPDAVSGASSALVADSSADLKSKSVEAPTKSNGKGLPDPGGPEVVKKKIVRMVPKRGPRIGNEDGFNDPEDAKAAAHSMADEDGLVPFPSSESLMRRLKSIINSCAKEYDRDQRELRKKELAATKAKQRKDDLAARKAEKEAEKSRQRKERRIAKSQPFSKKEAVEFEKALSNFGVDYKSDGKTVDWTWFNSKLDGFEAKYAETLDAAYVELLSEAHRIVDLAAAKEDEDYDRVDKINEGKKGSAVFSTLTVERAERLIERLQFFRVLRGEVLTHPKINSILRGFKKTRDLPLWWKSSHDRSLLLGVDRHGLNGWEVMAHDSELAFAASIKTWQRKNGNDVKALKRAAMPKASSGIKRAFALVRYFRSRANDPHFEHYSRDDGAGPSNSPKTANITVKEETLTIKMEATEEKPKVELLRRGVDDKAKNKRKAEAVQASSASGRPRTLRATIIDIPADSEGLILPTDLGDGLHLLSLGEIQRDAPGFCKNGIVYPVGYKTVRQVGSSAFLCEILATDDGAHPYFRVSSLKGFNPKSRRFDGMWTEKRLVAQGRDVVPLWLKVVNEEIVGDCGHDGKVALASGPERFGLYESTIVHHIQQLPYAKSVKGFDLRDFSRRGEGRKIEPTAGILSGMLRSIADKLEHPHCVKGLDAVMTDDDGRPMDRPVVAAEDEMALPEDWIAHYGGSKKKHRRRSNSYWG